MKRLLIRLLDMLGLVTVGRYKALGAKLRDVESRSKKLEKLAEHARVEAKEWKAKATDASKQSQGATRDATHHAARVEKFRAETDKLRAGLERARASQEELDALRTRLADAERELAVARDHLMAIEVKLDILEGAANVLDTRTRAVGAQREGETRARV